MNTNFPSSASEVKPGQIRCFTTAGHECCGLVFRSWDEDWLVCPVKNLVGDDEEPTGTAVFAQPTLECGLLGAGGLYALPELGGTVSAERVAASPIVWEVIPETVEQVWRLFRAPISDEWPDPEKDFHFFKNSHSEEDWEKSYIVLGPLDPDDGYVLLDEPDEDELRRKGYAKVSEVEIPNFDSRDNWGPCCSHCEFWGQPHKPCAVCAV